MKNIKLIAIAALVLVAGLSAFLIAKNVNNDKEQTAKKPLEEVTLALDWTPNTNHSGLYVAKNQGYYAEEGVELKLLPYSTSASSDALVSAGKADTGIGFTEGVVANAASDSQVTSIAAIITTNTSSIATRKSDNITSLDQLDGKIYGGYGMPYEEPVMKAAIKNDGGEGNFKNVTVSTAPLQALESGKVDFVWIFDGWEKIQAERSGFAIDTFPVIEHGIPDYYTPNIISSPDTISKKEDLLKRFMKATVRGYEFARNNPDEAARILIAEASEGTFDDEGLVYASQEYLSGKYQKPGKTWGIQEKSYWRNYPQFMLDNDAVLDVSGKPVDTVNFDALYTNKFIE
ncbi:ABC transporter substrate-binding protein [Candidatus Parcubacteria bacterium]|nr:ABC transporter substrate-binding protein [Candidatus Parcubacteria bacterium]